LSRKARLKAQGRPLLHINHGLTSREERFRTFTLNSPLFTPLITPSPGRLTFTFCSKTGIIAGIWRVKAENDQECERFKPVLP